MAKKQKVKKEIKVKPMTPKTEEEIAKTKKLTAERKFVRDRGMEKTRDFIVAMFKEAGFEDPDSLSLRYCAGLCQREFFDASKL